MSAISAAILLPMALDGHEIHDQVDWISALGLKAGAVSYTHLTLPTNREV